MNRILTALLLLVALVATAGAGNKTMTNSNLNKGIDPLNVVIDTLFDATAQSNDTLATTEIAYVGPYSLTPSVGGAMYSSFTLHAKKVTGTTPTAGFDYALLPGPKMSDTSGIWTPVDTLDGTGAEKNVSLSGVSARFILFRVNNFDGTTTVVPSPVIIMWKKGETYNVTKR